MSLESFLVRASGRCTHCLYHVETQGCRCGGAEWDLFVAALRQCVRADGLISVNDVRPLVARIPPKRRARFWQLAQHGGSACLIKRSNRIEDSTDTRGKNQHKPQVLYIATAALGAVAA